MRRLGGNILKSASPRPAEGRPDLKLKCGLADYSIIKEQVEQSLDPPTVSRK